MKESRPITKESALEHLKNSHSVSNFQYTQSPKFWDMLRDEAFQQNVVDCLTDKISKLREVMTAPPPNAEDARYQGSRAYRDRLNAWEKLLENVIHRNAPTFKTVEKKVLSPQGLRMFEKAQTFSDVQGKISLENLQELVRDKQFKRDVKELIQSKIEAIETGVGGFEDASEAAKALQGWQKALSFVEGVKPSRSRSK